MQKRHPGSSRFLPALVAAVWLIPAAPVQASEVVRLARLVITGKRAPLEPTAAERAQIRQQPPVLIDGRGSEERTRVAAQPRPELKAL